MDRAFLRYYEEELGHLRGLAAEFADLHPAVARNIALDTVPCPDPYVERLLEGVAYLAARTRLKLDDEGARLTRAVLDALYPDFVAPTPALGMAALQPGRQLETMPGGHRVPRGTRLVAGLRPGLGARAIYTTAQEVTLWPIEIAAVRHLQDRSALRAAGLGALAGTGAESALGITIRRTGAGALSELDLDRLDIHFRDRARAPALFDALHGAGLAPRARAGERLIELDNPHLVGLGDAEALLPRARPGFEGYRLLREYFAMPERFHFVRAEGLRPAVARAGADLELVFPFRRATPELGDVRAPDLQLFATPIVNLFERDCDLVDIDPTRTRQPLHADRTRPRDFEIYRVVSVEDALREGPDAVLPSVFDLAPAAPRGVSWWMERRPRRPGEDERRLGRMRTSYPGDDAFLAFSVQGLAQQGAGAVPPRRVAVRALCTNRDLPLLDEQPDLSVEGGDPVGRVVLLGALRPPRPSLPAGRIGPDGAEGQADTLAWRLVTQLSLNYLGLAAEGAAVEPLRATIRLYADRGDPVLARHAEAIAGVTAVPAMERLPINGPLCFGRGTEVILDIDERMVSGHSRLLLTRLLAQLFVRYAAVNAFVRTRVRLLQSHEEATWPPMIGNRSLV